MEQPQRPVALINDKLSAHQQSMEILYNIPANKINMDQYPKYSVITQLDSTVYRHESNRLLIKTFFLAGVNKVKKHKCAFISLRSKLFHLHCV